MPEQSQQKVKVLKKGERQPPEHPLYQTFCYQISAALGVARQIASDGDRDSTFVRRFLDDYGRKVT